MKDKYQTTWNINKLKIRKDLLSMHAFYLIKDLEVSYLRLGIQLLRII